MMNKYPIVALVLLLAGVALILNCASISCSFSGDSGLCQVNGSCSGNCGANCGGNCGENCTCPNAVTGIQNNSTEDNCSALGSCPIKALSAGDSR
ncbi:MAG: hypothetical protein PHS80_13095 [Methanothrix sp.]|nr:hypothetical protein [Methanothrix sp.]MDD4446334.1 hypothetical protein [Methanothrix sp.]